MIITDLRNWNTNSHTIQIISFVTESEMRLRFMLTECRRNYSRFRRSPTGQTLRLRFIQKLPKVMTKFTQ